MLRLLRGCFVLRAASRAETAFRARSDRFSGVPDRAAFFARAVLCSGVIEAAAFFPPSLPFLRRKSKVEAENILPGTLSA